MEKIIQDINNLIKIIQPNNILFLAVDGSKPLAKLNHDRALVFQLQ
jgi:5'-3' exonuclease